jgi:hypothetical protein
VSRTWILTGSPENHEATRAHEFAVKIWPGKPGKPGKATPLLDRMAAAAGTTV